MCPCAPVPHQVGQLIWCLAHTMWIGNTFMLTTTAGLMAHHLFGCWHGDRRLSAKYGEVGCAMERWSLVYLVHKYRSSLLHR